MPPLAFIRSGDSYYNYPLAKLILRYVCPKSYWSSSLPRRSSFSNTQVALDLIGFNNPVQEAFSD